MFSEEKMGEIGEGLEYTGRREGLKATIEF